MYLFFYLEKKMMTLRKVNLPKIPVVELGFGTQLGTKELLLSLVDTLPPSTVGLVLCIDR